MNDRCNLHYRLARRAASRRGAARSSLAVGLAAVIALAACDRQGATVEAEMAEPNLPPPTNETSVAASPNVPLVPLTPPPANEATMDGDVAAFHALSTKIDQLAKRAQSLPEENREGLEQEIEDYRQWLAALEQEYRQLLMKVENRLNEGMQVQAAIPEESAPEQQALVD